MIWLSEKRDVFTQNFLDPIRRKFYFQRVLFSGGITIGPLKTEACGVSGRDQNQADSPKHMPPRGKVAGSNPAWDTIFFKA